MESHLQDGAPKVHGDDPTEKRKRQKHGIVTLSTGRLVFKGNWSAEEDEVLKRLLSLCHVTLCMHAFLLLML
jgi:hypothetical protein